MALTSKLGTSDSSLLGSTMVAGLSDPFNITLSHSLNLQSFTGAEGIVAQVLPMGHTVLFDIVIGETQNLLHDLGIGHTVEFSGTINFLEAELGISHVVEYVNFSPLEHNLRMSHEVIVTGPIPVTVTHTLAMTHVAGLVKEESVTQNLNLTHFAADVQKQELGLTHSVMAYVNASPHFEQDLGISHTVQVSANYIANFAHTDVVAHAVTYFVDDGTGCPGNQFNNWGTLGEKPFVSQTGAKLVFTNITGTDDLVVLKNPELDDRDRVGYTRINRETRGGELQMFRDPTWPLVNTIQGTIVGLKKQDVEDWQDFMSDHLGEEISMADWHGRYWRGVIINPGEPAVEDTRDRWTVAFEFEGVEMDGVDVIQQVGISHVLQVQQLLTRDMSHTLGLGHTVVVETNQVLHNGDSVFYNGAKVTYSG